MVDVPIATILSEEEFALQNVEAGSEMKEVPNKIRFLVEAAPNKESKIATLQKFYDNVSEAPDNPNNFIVSNTGGENFIVDNKNKINFGDFIDMGKEITEIVASTGGAVAGTAVAPGAGTIIGSGAGMALGAEIFEQVGQKFGTEVLRTNKEHLAQRGTDFAFGSVGQAVAPLIIKGGKYIIVGGSKQISESGKRLKSFVDAGVKPSLSQVTQNKGIQTVELVLGNIPGSSGKIANFAAQAQNDLGKFSLKTASKLIEKTLPANEVQVGLAIKNGIKNGVNAADGFVGRFNSRAGVLFDDVGTYLKPDTLVKLNNENGTISQLTKLISPVKGAEATSKAFKNTFLSEVFEGLQKDIAKNNGSLPYEAVVALKQKIGRKLASFNLIGDVDKGELKLIYGALSEDIKASLKGNAKALKSFKNANNYYKAGLARIEKYLEPIYKAGDPDKIASMLINSGKEGSTRINAIKKSLNPEQYKIFLSSVIEKIGRIQASQGLAAGSDDVVEAVGRFSSETFLTNWNKLSSSAKKAMFSGKGFEGMRADLDKIATISSIIRESGKTFRNPSGTADRLAGMGLMFGAGAGVVTNPVFTFIGIPAVIFGANRTAALLTNPNFVKWMAKGIDIAGNKGMDGVIEHTGKLGVVMANADSDTRQAIYEYLQMLQGADKNKK